MNKIEIKLNFIRSTKGTHLYGTDSTETPITSLYVKKHGLPETPPPAILVIVVESEA